MSTQTDVSDEGLRTLANASRSQALVALQYIVDLSAGVGALHRLAVAKRGDPRATLYNAAHQIVAKDLDHFIDNFVGNLDNEKNYRAELQERKDELVRRSAEATQGGIQAAVSRAFGHAESNNRGDTASDLQSSQQQAE